MDLTLDLGIAPIESTRQKLATLLVLENSQGQPQIAVPTIADSDCDVVAEELAHIAGGSAALAAAIGRAIRKSYDQVYDGQRTGRFHWAQLSKTEKTNAGSLVEIWLARELGLRDGITLDFQIAGHEVDCKFSQRDGGWMLPPEVRGSIAMVVTADDYQGTWSLGLVRVTDERLSTATNRDAKATLNSTGRSAISWLFRNAQLPSNTLLALPAEDAVAIMGRSDLAVRPSGQSRLDELFRRAEGRVISRAVIATVAQQEDPMKRVRSNGGSRSRLAREGYVLLGHYQSHRHIAETLGLPPARSGEILSVRLTPAEVDTTERTVTISMQRWRRWRTGDPVVSVPAPPHN